MNEPTQSRVVSMRKLKEFDDHEMVINLSDARTHLKAFVTIHSTKLGPALGGTRFRFYDNDTEALRDALNLSSAMSKKCAMAKLPWGGGKAVIVANKIEDKQAALEAYSRLVDKLSGLFKTGTDVGISDDDVKNMGKFTAHMLGVKEHDRGDLTTSSMAALGVYYSIKAACGHAFGTEKLTGRTIGIKGLGKLGGELARLCLEEGAKLVIADVDEVKVKKITKLKGNIVVSTPEEIPFIPMDVYAPCAFGGEISESNVDKFNCTIIAGGANNQLDDPVLGEKLFKRNILYVPDYIANAGGLIYVADELESDGFRKDRVLRRVKGIQRTVEDVFERSKNLKKSPSQISDELAEQIINKDQN